MSEAVAFRAPTRRLAPPPPLFPTRAPLSGLLPVSAFLLLALAASPLRAQSRGEVQVTAQVLPAQAGYQALAAARAPTATQTNTLFRVRWARRPDAPGASRAEKSSLVVTVEFLAN